MRKLIILGMLMLTTLFGQVKELTGDDFEKALIERLSESDTHETKNTYLIEKIHQNSNNDIFVSNSSYVIQPRIAVFSVKYNL